MLVHPYGYTFGDITYHLNRKLPLPIRKVYSLATECVSYQEMGCILYEYAKTKSALNLNQVCKIAHCYFKDRYIFFVEYMYKNNNYSHMSHMKSRRVGNLPRVW